MNTGEHGCRAVVLAMVGRSDLMHGRAGTVTLAEDARTELDRLGKPIACRIVAFPSELLALMDDPRGIR